MKTFIAFIQDKYATIQTDGDSFKKLMSSTQPAESEIANDTLDSPITI
jgi:hypothetical protein